MKRIYKINVNNKPFEVELDEVTTVQGDIEVSKSEKAPLEQEETPKQILVGGEKVTAPMPGTIVDIKVHVGDEVSKGQLIAILEAMKMETEILSPDSGTVAEIHVGKGVAINLGDAIVSLA